jgi:hypothetical protein
MSEIVISEFLVSPTIVLIDDIKELYNDSKCLKAFCRNKSAFPYVKSRIKKWLPVHFKWISSHCNDIDFLRKNKDKIDYSEICKNSCIIYIIDLLEGHLEELNWRELSKNPYAYSLLSKYPEYIDWWFLCQNTSIEVMNMLESHYMEYVKWLPLSSNPSAINILKKNLKMIDKTALNINPKGFEILREHPELIDYKFLCSNQSKEAVEIIEKNIKREDICFELLSANKYAINLLIKNPDKIDWYMAIDNEEIGQLFKSFPDKLNSMIIKYVIRYKSVIPFLKEYLYDISPTKLAENPSLFKIDDFSYKFRKNIFQKIVSKFM